MIAASIGRTKPPIIHAAEGGMGGVGTGAATAAQEYLRQARRLILTERFHY